VLRKFLKQAIAVVVGNLLYFFVLMPHLPAADGTIPTGSIWD